MAEQVPILIKTIPPLVTHIGAAFGPIDLKEYIKSPIENGERVFFRGELADGLPFPAGLICTENGLLTGIAAEGSDGNYEIFITAENEGGTFSTSVKLTIKERIEIPDPFLLTTLKSQVWEALGQNLPLPELQDLVNRPISPVEIYYLLQRYAVLTIWDVYNLDSPSTKHTLNLNGANKHYHFYDRGSCLVAAPKDLFSHERTLADALDASRTLAQEVYKRGWTIEFAGFNKMVRAAWVELQLLGNKHGKKIEILHYVPNQEDLRAYNKETQGPSKLAPE